MTEHRSYKALFDFVARDDKELSMKAGDLLLVKRGPDGTWPSAEKWMFGTNKTTSKSGDFPGGDYVELVKESISSPPDPTPTAHSLPPKPPSRRVSGPSKGRPLSGPIKNCALRK